MSHDVVAALRRAAEAEEPGIVRMLQRWVQIPSINGAIEGGTGEQAVQEAVAGELEDLGCQVRMWEPDPEAVLAAYPAAEPSIRSRDFRGRPNVVATLPGAGSSVNGHYTDIILNSHCDTVAPGPAEGWAHPPFSGLLADGRIHGLGSVDAKGCLASYVGALRILRRAGLRLEGSVAVQSVADEEVGGVGALACVEQGYRAPLALVGEPTGLRLSPASRGSYGFILRARGKKAHPGSAWVGVNAIEKAMLCVQALRKMQQRLDRERMHPLWAPLPMGHVWNLMAMNSGPSGRAVPDFCEVSYTAGSVGGETFETIRGYVEEAITEAAAADEWLRAHPPQLEWTSWRLDSAAVDPNHPAIGALQEAGELLGYPRQLPVAFSAGTDGRHLTNFGGIPAINFGPGDISVCHSPREALAVSELVDAATWVALFLARTLGVASGPTGGDLL